MAKKTKPQQSGQTGADTEADETRDAPQPRPFWSGVITFGLVSLPVSLFPANRGKSFSLSMVDADGMPLKRRYYCEREDKLLDSDDIVRGFPVGEDRFVTVEDEELEALAPDKTREIDLSRFVPRGDINPVFFARGYFLAPDENATKAYRLLAKSMEDEQRAGVATFVMREREYIVAIVAERGILRAETLRFHDEIRDPDAIGLPALADPPDKLVEQVQSAIEALSEATLDRDLLTEQETIQARELIAHKLKTGTDVVAAPAAPEYEKDSNVVDLMQVLRERLQGKNASTEHRM